MKRYDKVPKELSGQSVRLGSRNLTRTVREVRWNKLNRTYQGIVSYSGTLFTVHKKGDLWQSL